MKYCLLIRTTEVTDIFSCKDLPTKSEMILIIFSLYHGFNVNVFIVNLIKYDGVALVWSSSPTHTEDLIWFRSSLNVQQSTDLWSKIHQNHRKLASYLKGSVLNLHNPPHFWHFVDFKLFTSMRDLISKYLKYFSLNLHTLYWYYCTNLLVFFTHVIMSYL